MRHSTLTGLPSCLRSSFTTGSYGAGTGFSVALFTVYLRRKNLRQELLLHS